MAKSEHQLDIERQLSQFANYPEKRLITEESEMHDPSLKVGDVVTVVQWGTFGCWDKDGRWVDFYASV